MCSSQKFPNREKNNLVLSEQKAEQEKETAYWKGRVNNLIDICSELKIELQQLKDSTRVSVAHIKREKDTDDRIDTDHGCQRGAELGRLQMCDAFRFQRRLRGGGNKSSASGQNPSVAGNYISSGGADGYHNPPDISIGARSHQKLSSIGVKRSRYRVCTYVTFHDY